jgi:plasmid stability protein
MNISIKNVPEEIVASIRARAKRHHRSLQGELLAVLEESLTARRLSSQELFARVKDLGLRTGPDSATFVREDRDAR